MWHMWYVIVFSVWCVWYVHVCGTCICGVYVCGTCMCGVCDVVYMWYVYVFSVWCVVHVCGTCTCVVCAGVVCVCVVYGACVWGGTCEFFLLFPESSLQTQVWVCNTSKMGFWGQNEFYFSQRLWNPKISHIFKTGMSDNATASPPRAGAHKLAWAPCLCGHLSAGLLSKTSS